MEFDALDVVLGRPPSSFVGGANMNGCKMVGRILGGVVLVGLAAGPALADLGKSTSPLDVLRARGLEPGHHRYLLDDEKGISEELRTARKAVGAAQTAWTRSRAVEENEAAISTLQQRAKQLSQAANSRSQQSSGYRSRGRSSRYASNSNPVAMAAREQLAMVQAELSQRQSQQVKPDAKRKLDEEADQSRRDAISALDSLESSMGRVLNHYKELEADAVVKEALAAANQAARVNTRLGPSDEFTKAAHWVVEARKMLKATPNCAADKAKAKPKSS